VQLEVQIHRLLLHYQIPIIKLLKNFLCCSKKLNEKKNEKEKKRKREKEKKRKSTGIHLTEINDVPES